jgi:ADP-ribose pyrophosphatase
MPTHDDWAATKVPTRSTTIYASRWATVREDDVRLSAGGTEQFLVVSRSNFVVVVAEHPDGRILMVEQFRYAAGRWSLELPQGGREPGEAAPEAALRELREETGWAAEQPVVLAERLYEAGDWATQHFSVVRARPTGRATSNVDTGEHGLRVELVDPARLPALVADGAIWDAATLAGLYVRQQFPPAGLEDASCTRW